MFFFCFGSFCYLGAFNRKFYRNRHIILLFPGIFCDSLKKLLLHVKSKLDEVFYDQKKRVLNTPCTLHQWGLRPEYFFFLN